MRPYKRVHLYLPPLNWGNAARRTQERLRVEDGREAHSRPRKQYMPLVLSSVGWKIKLMVGPEGVGGKQPNCGRLYVLN